MRKPEKTGETERAAPSDGRAGYSGEGAAAKEQQTTKNTLLI